jgi:hypothetical protein
VHTFFTPAYQVGIHLDMNCQWLSFGL